VHQTARMVVAAGLLLAVLATNGCDRTTDSQSGVRAPVPEMSAPVSQRENATAKVVHGAGAQADEPLHAEIAAAQSQERTLLIERDRIARLVESHQLTGEQRLAALKEQLQSFDGKRSSDPDAAAARERFAERARVEMESALMMDEEYRAQLQEAEEKLRQTQQQLRQLRARQAD
jgi:hypothetical protein